MPLKNKTLTAWLLFSLLIGPAICAGATIGHPAPAFSAQDTNGHPIALSDFMGKIVVLEWTNPKCPFVMKHYGSGNMQALQKTYTAQGVIWISINSGSPGREGYCTPAEANQVVADRHASPTAVILDVSGSIGHLYDAKATPHMFIISPGGILIYSGAIDSIPTHNVSDLPLATNYVKVVLDEMLAGKPVTIHASQPYGCSVKYAK